MPEPSQWRPLQEPSSAEQSGPQSALREVLLHGSAVSGPPAKVAGAAQDSLTVRGEKSATRCQQYKVGT